MAQAAARHGREPDCQLGPDAGAVPAGRRSKHRPGSGPQRRHSWGTVPRREPGGVSPTVVGGKLMRGKARALPWTRWGLRPQTPISAARLFHAFLAKPVTVIDFLASPFPGDSL